jgi:hypothetical protein
MSSCVFYPRNRLFPIIYSSLPISKLNAQCFFFFNKGNLTGILLAIFIPIIAIVLILFGLFYYVKINKGSNLFSVFSRKGKLPIDDSYEDMQMKEKNKE